MRKMLKRFKWVWLALCIILVSNMALCETNFKTPLFSSKTNEEASGKTSLLLQDEHTDETGNVSSFEVIIEQINSVINEIKNKKDVDNNKKKLKKLQHELRTTYENIYIEFARTKKALNEKGYSSVVLKRQSEFEAKIGAEYNELQNVLEEIFMENGKDLGVDSSKLSKLCLISKSMLCKKPNLSENDKLPFRKNSFPRRNPNQNSTIIPAYKAMQGLLLQENEKHINTLSETPSDLKETIEVKITPEIKELACELGKNPVKIFSYVHNNIKYDPYYGSIKGAQETLNQKCGNDFDQASLLIALYRASGIPARYVYGVTKIPTDQAENWIGVKTDNGVVSLLASSGVPVMGLSEGSKYTYILMEHVWVEAYIPVNYYRGSSINNTGKCWVPIDPSFKKYKEIKGINNSDIPNPQGIRDVIHNTSTVGDNGASITNLNMDALSDKVAETQSNMVDYIKNNYDLNSTNVMDRRDIVKEFDSVLSLSLPYEVLNVTNEFSEVTDEYRQKMTITVKQELKTPFVYSAFLPELAGKRISLNYVVNSEEDAKLLVDSMPRAHDDGTPMKLNEFRFPAYLIKVKPLICVDGEVVTEGDVTSMGELADLSVEFTNPGAKGVDSNIKAIVTTGSTYVFTLDTGQMYGDRTINDIKAIKKNVEGIRSNDYDKAGLDTFTEKFLHTVGMKYFSDLDNKDQQLANTLGVRLVRTTSLAITSISESVDYLFGSPVSMTSRGVVIDVQRNVHTIESIDGDKTRTDKFCRISGSISSYLEGQVFESSMNKAGMSAASIILVANCQGIKVFCLNKDNIDENIDKLQYSSETKEKIINLINNGKEIIIPEKAIAFGSIVGMGYVITDPRDGSSAYIIVNGYNGGASWDTFKALALNALGLLEKLPKRLLIGLNILGTFDSIMSKIEFYEGLDPEYQEQYRLQIEALITLDILNLALGVATIASGLAGPEAWLATIGLFALNVYIDTMSRTIMDSIQTDIDFAKWNWQYMNQLIAQNKDWTMRMKYINQKLTGYEGYGEMWTDSYFPEPQYE